MSRSSLSSLSSCMKQFRLLQCGKVPPDAMEVMEEAPPEAATEAPIVVELFSSQGCAMSPEAEMLLSRMERGDFKLAGPVVILAYHVDYWDYMGWKDPYASSKWTVRQKAYVQALRLDSIYTPLVVVQGRTQCVANDVDAVLSLIADAPRFPSPAFEASFMRPTSECLQVTITGPLRTRVDDNGVDIMVALYENGLVVDCEKGENKGKLLANDFVIRKLERLCTVKDLSPRKPISVTATFTLWDTFDETKCGAAIFVQNSAHQIFGSLKLQLPNDI